MTRLLLVYQILEVSAVQSKCGIGRKISHVSPKCGSFFTNVVSWSKTHSSSAHDGTLEIIPDEPFRGVSPGQVAALWDGDWCLGCGIITEPLPPPQLQDFNVSQRPHHHRSPQLKKKRNNVQILPRKQDQPHHITQGSPQARAANGSTVENLDKQVKEWQWW